MNYWSAADHSAYLVVNMERWTEAVHGKSLATTKDYQGTDNDVRPVLHIIACEMQALLPVWPVSR